MKHAAIMMLCLISVSCGQRISTDYSFSSPSGGTVAVVVVGPSAYEVNVHIKAQSSKRTIDEHINFHAAKIGEGRAWAGWSRSEQQLSLLICNAEFSPRVFRVSLASATEHFTSSEHAGFLESDQKLLLSLRQLHSKVNKFTDTKDLDIIEWYCSGQAESSLRQFQIPLESKFRIPSKIE